MEPIQIAALQELMRRYAKNGRLQADCDRIIIDKMKPDAKDLQEEFLRSEMARAKFGLRMKGR